MRTGNYVIYSNTDCSVGLRPRVTWMSDSDIIDAADAELIHTSITLEDMAGIEWVDDENGNPTPARTLTYDEMLYFSIAALTYDGALFQTFRLTDAGAAEFIAAADDWGLGDEARALVDKCADRGAQQGLNA